jgi:hypothetical protein
MSSNTATGVTSVGAELHVLVLICQWTKNNSAIHFLVLDHLCHPTNPSGQYFAD